MTKSRPKLETLKFGQKNTTTTTTFSSYNGTTATSELITGINNVTDSVMKGKKNDVNNINIDVLAKKYEKEKDGYEGARIKVGPMTTSP